MVAGIVIACIVVFICIPIGCCVFLGMCASRAAGGGGGAGGGSNYQAQAAAMTMPTGLVDQAGPVAPGAFENPAYAPPGSEAYSAPPAAYGAPAAVYGAQAYPTDISI